MKKSVNVTQPLVDQYGRINGDNDILHYDHDFAVSKGFRGTLAHGLHMMGIVGEMAARNYGRDWYYEGDIYVKWIAPVCPGDTVEFGIGDDGVITSEGPHGTTMVGHAKLAG